MAKGKQIYEGKAKILYEGPEKGTLIQYFKDDATAFNNKKKAIIDGKGVLNNRISEFLLSQLNQIGIKTHFIKRLNMREQLIKSLEIIPIEVVVRNIAAGTFSTRLGISEGTDLSKPILEFYYKNDELGDPLVNEEHILALEWSTQSELIHISEQALRINDFLIGLFRGIGIKLVDFKLEFGRQWNGDEAEVFLADEISPDTCRLWDVKDERKLDKDRFRRDLGGLVEAYQEVARRLGIMPEGSNIKEIKTGLSKNLTALKKNKKLKLQVIVTLKKDVLDPQGSAIKSSLSNMGFKKIENLRQGKTFEITVKEKNEKVALSEAKEMCEKLLANMTIEDYSVKVIKE